MCGWRRTSLSVIVAQRIGDGEAARVGLDLREEDALEDQVADLAAQRVVVAAIDRVEHFVASPRARSRAATRASARDPTGSRRVRAAAP